MTELTNNLRKTVASLGQARNRRLTGWFVAEGTKCVLETLGAFRTAHLFATAQWIQQHPTPGVNPTQVTAADIQRMSQLQTPQQVIAVYHIPDPEPVPAGVGEQLTLALDRIQDPGNMGTIMRVADWFGIRLILASPDTVDIYNPKVVQATMGAIARVKVIYTPLAETLAALPEHVPVYGTFLDGKNIYDTPLKSSGIIVMGNEGNGISAEVARCVTAPLFIPPFPVGADTVESLNVGVATAVTVAEFRRRTKM
ncbi:MAG: RNA methyltransferase [Muribaculaceae bacterium]|nr:RNA methyltransferase [Muribaculaceae bacterium]